MKLPTNYFTSLARSFIACKSSSSVGTSLAACSRFFPIVKIDRPKISMIEVKARAIGGWVSEHYSPRIGLALTSIMLVFGLAILTIGKNRLQAANDVPTE